MKLHDSITPERLEELASENLFGLGTSGICNNCGEEIDDIEPDTRDAECEICGAMAVYGVEELLLHVA